MSRAKILYDLWHEFNDQCLLSSLKNTEVDPWIIPSQGINLERLEDWVSDQELFKKWFASCPVKSVDDHSIRDQYVTNPQTNSDILNFYNQFAVELVSETYTLGDTFFPTEKTVRPLMAAKPIIVYGPKNYLKRLKDLGFDTYHQCWNESYDQLEGPERWAAIKQLLPTVTLSDVAMDIALHNRQHLANLIKE
jgi:hypothetical protein